MMRAAHGTAASGATRPAGDASATTAIKHDQAGVLALLRLEAAVREIATIPELRHFLANETWKLVRARQTFLVELVNGSPRVTCVSSLAVVDRNAPLVRLFEQIVARLRKTHDLAQVAEFRLDGLVDKNGDEGISYPFREVAWLPLRSRKGEVFGGLVLTRETAWQVTCLTIVRRLTGTYSHAWQAMRMAKPSLLRLPRINRRRIGGLLLCAALALGLLLPVPISALAPAEVVPRDAAVVAATLDGVIAEVLVSPNDTVAKGGALLRYAATDLDNSMRIAEQKVLVAEARLKRARQSAFSEQEGRREIAVTEAELAVAIAERDRSRDLFGKTIVRAERGGLVLFADRKDLVGRPVAVGERLMEIAAPGQVQLRIDMPVVDALLLQRSAAVAAYLDSDPLKPLSAAIEQTDYRAREIEGRRLAVRGLAAFSAMEAPPRLGVRGVAKVYGADVPLGLYIFRRPISAARQWLGL